MSIDSQPTPPPSVTHLLPLSVLAPHPATQYPRTGYRPLAMNQHLVTTPRRLPHRNCWKESEHM